MLFQYDAGLKVQQIGAFVICMLQVGKNMCTVCGCIRNLYKPPSVALALVFVVGKKLFSNKVVTDNCIYTYIVHTYAHKWSHLKFLQHVCNCAKSQAVACVITSLKALSYERVYEKYRNH